jgi:hypothetical protein
VVKAKIQDIEGKKGTQQQQQQQQQQVTPSGEKQLGTQLAEPRPVGTDAVVKRTSVLSTQRPQSEIIFHSPYVGVVEVNDPSDSESHASTTLSNRELDSGAMALLQTHTRSAFSSLRGPSSERQMGRRSTAADVFAGSGKRSSEHHDSPDSGAVFNAWAGILPTEDLRADDLASVLELKRKFERGSPKDPGKRLQQQTSSLRRSRSLRDTRLTSPPVRLGGSARWKKYSSNASLQWSGERPHRVSGSASPTAGGSQLSLSSSGKL